MAVARPRAASASVASASVAAYTNVRPFSSTAQTSPVAKLRPLEVTTESGAASSKTSTVNSWPAVFVMMMSSPWTVASKSATPVWMSPASEARSAAASPE